MGLTECFIYACDGTDFGKTYLLATFISSDIITLFPSFYCMWINHISVLRNLAAASAASSTQQQPRVSSSEFEYSNFEHSKLLDTTTAKYSTIAMSDITTTPLKTASPKTILKDDDGYDTRLLLLILSTIIHNFIFLLLLRYVMINHVIFAIYSCFYSLILFCWFLDCTHWNLVLANVKMLWCYNYLEKSYLLIKMSSCWLNLKRKKIIRLGFKSCWVKCINVQCSR